MSTVAKHPATYSSVILDRMARILNEEGLGRQALVLDPFAGTGLVHRLPYRTVGVELEPEWAAVEFWRAAGAESICADSLAWMGVTRRRFDAVVTSPCYGNRMADHHEANDPCSECGGARTVQVAGTRRRRQCPKCKGSGLSPRRSYRHDLGRMPSQGSSAVMPFGDEYKAFHRRAWEGAFRVTKPGGVFLLNSKNFVRRGRIIRVNEWHRAAALAAGWRWERTVQVKTPGMRYGANRQARVRSEVIYVFRRPFAAQS